METLTKKYICYKITNTVNGKGYIGQTSQALSRRLKQHRRTNSRCSALYSAIQKHGWESFNTHPLAQGLSLEQANVLEEKYIAEYNTLFPSGYNLNKGGTNRYVSEETRAKQSAAQRGKHLSEETRQKMSAARRGNQNRLGKHLSTEHKANLLAANKGRRCTAKTRAKISAANKNRSVEIRAKIAAANRERWLGKHLSEETKAKISNAKFGKRPSNETRAKLSAARLGKHSSNETKAKMSATMKRMWAERKQRGY